MWSVVVSTTAKGNPVLAVHDTSNVDRLSTERSVRQGKNECIVFYGVGPPKVTSRRYFAASSGGVGLI